MKNEEKRRILELAGVVHRNHSKAFELLLEEEDDAGGGLFGDDNEDDKKDDAETEDSEKKGDDAEEGDDDKKEDEKEEEEEVVKVSKEDEAMLGPSIIDQELDAALQQAFDSATKSAAVNKQTPSYPGAEETVEESLSKKSMGWLLKEEADDELDAPPDPKEFDMEYFTGQVARYINNYQNILDMEGMLFNKARQFLMNKFGQAAADEMEELLAVNHDIDLKDQFDEEVPEMTAAGASKEAAGA
jgi:hypothetical protein